jgi:Leucine-rich repeat (LRR) protein
MQALRVNRSNSYPVLSNIMSLDLSYNNISMIEVTFFEPVENGLKVLNLSSNAVEEISPDDVGQLRRLRCIDLSRNRLHTIEPTTFMAARKLQSVYLQDNRLEAVSPTMFSSQNCLQFADFSR